MNTFLRRVTRPLLLILFGAVASACCWHPNFGHAYRHCGGHYHFRHCR